MIIITGSGRAGTSLLMQTLKIWKMPIAGVPFHPDFPVKSLNPRGYYDLPYKVLMAGVGLQFKGMAVKVFGHWLNKVASEHVSKVIVCKRRSLTEQDNSLMKAYEAEVKVTSSSQERMEMLEDIPTLQKLGVIRRNNYREVRKFLNRNKNIESITVYFEDILDNTKEEMTKIANFLNVDCENIQDAIDNVQPQEIQNGTCI